MTKSGIVVIALFLAGTASGQGVRISEMVEKTATQITNPDSVFTEAAVAGDTSQSYKVSIGTILKKTVGQAINVKAFGAIGDGTTNDTSAIQAAAATVTTGGELFFPRGTYLVSAPITFSTLNKISIVGQNATIKEATPVNVSVLSFTSCNDVEVANMRFEGTEDFTYFNANSPTERRQFLYATLCNGVQVRDIRGSGKRGLFHAYLCNNVRVDGYDYSGFLSNLTVGGSQSLTTRTITGVQANAKEVLSILFRGVLGASVSNGHVNNAGSALLCELDTGNISVNQVYGEQLHDNGIYISSANSVAINTTNFDICGGSGVKVRTVNATVTNNTAKDISSAAVHISAVVPSAFFDAGNYGISAVGNVSSGCGRGVQIETGYGTKLRNIAIANNVVTDSAVSSGGAIEINTDQRGLSVTGNTINNTGSPYGILIAHSGTVNTWASSTAYVVDNYVRFNGGVYRCLQDHTSTGSFSVDIAAGRWTESLSEVSITGNSVTGMTNSGGIPIGMINACGFAITGNTVFSNKTSYFGIRLFTCGNGIISGNTYPNSDIDAAGEVATVNSGNVNVTIVGNRGGSISADHAANTVHWNDVRNTYYSATSVIPHSVGIITYSGGNAYISTGTSATSDWKQITP